MLELLAGMLFGGKDKSRELVQKNGKKEKARSVWADAGYVLLILACIYVGFFW